jgi:hypothetical protein
MIYKITNTDNTGYDCIYRYHYIFALKGTAVDQQGLFPFKDYYWYCSLPVA